VACTHKLHRSAPHGRTADERFCSFVSSERGRHNVKRTCHRGHCERVWTLANDRRVDEWASLNQLSPLRISGSFDHDTGRVADFAGWRPPRGLRFPPLHDGGSVGYLDLFGITLMVERHQRTMSFIGGTANSIPNDDNAIAKINCAEYGCKHANVHFRSGHNQAISLSRLQVLEKLRLHKCGIPRLVYDGRGRTKVCK
jgi:hypothetical protein